MCTHSVCIWQRACGGDGDDDDNNEGLQLPVMFQWNKNKNKINSWNQTRFCYWTNWYLYDAHVLSLFQKNVIKLNILNNKKNEELNAHSSLNHSIIIFRCPMCKIVKLLNGNYNKKIEEG